VATPLAGIFHMKFRRFLAFDALGAIFWAGTYLGLGYIFSGQIEFIALKSQQLGGGLMVLLVASLAFILATNSWPARDSSANENCPHQPGRVEGKTGRR